MVVYALALVFAFAASDFMGEVLGEPPDQQISALHVGTEFIGMPPRKFADADQKVHYTPAIHRVYIASGADIRERERKGGSVDVAIAHL